MVDPSMEKLHLPILVEIDEDSLYIISCTLSRDVTPGARPSMRPWRI
jgi:hypothetical protein